MQENYTDIKIDYKRYIRDSPNGNRLIVSYDN